MHSREGMTQGESLDMIVHDIGILQLMKKLKKEFPDVTQPWYVDGPGELGTFSRIEAFPLFARTTRPRTRVLPQSFKKHIIRAS